MSPKNYLLILSLICIIWTHQSYANAVTQSNVIINYPTSNIFIPSNTITLSGSFTSPDQNPLIVVSLDGGTQTNADTFNNNWSYYVNLSNGWHTATITISDSNGIHSSSVQFLTYSGSITVNKYDIIAVEYSEVCQRMIDNNITNSCPSVGELKQFDTSNQNISGKFVMSKDGTWTRTKPQSLNHYSFYNNDTNKIVCVLCEVDLSSPDLLQTIFIEPNGFSYVKHTSESDVEQNTNVNSTVSINSNYASLTVFYDRYVDDSCVSANMDYSHDLMVDTIGYLKSGCTITHFNKTSTSIIPSHTFSFNSPYSSLNQDAYLQSIFHNHKYFNSYNETNAGGLGPSNCINVKCNYKDPTAKW